MNGAGASSSQPQPDTNRVHPEVKDPLRGPFELDRHRIITSTSFRRLRNKTQVFAPTLHDHFRNRLTHTLEVAQIARTLARIAGGNESLCEAIALAHDLGHPPFSHAGEKALAELMAGRGGFNHNAHSVRVVEYLEHPYPDFRGLNLTKATLDGLGAHATRYDQPDAAAAEQSLEARIVSVADRVAYDLHDLEDAMGAKIVGEADLRGLALWAEAFAAVTRGVEAGKLHAVRRPVLDGMLDRLLVDGVGQLQSQVQSITSPFESRILSPAFSAPLEHCLVEFESFLLEHVYKHPDVARADAEGQTFIHELFSAYMKDPERLPHRFADRIGEQGPYRVICDYIAGMSDSYCIAQHRLHCGSGTC